eukprot:COSAG01_NODE_2261_length_8057_cov_38.489570_5_plen_203_part_00
MISPKANVPGLALPLAGTSVATARRQLHTGGRKEWRGLREEVDAINSLTLPACSSSSPRVPPPQRGTPLVAGGGGASPRGARLERVSPPPARGESYASPLSRETGSSSPPSSSSVYTTRSRAEYVVDMTSQKLYMANLNRNRFRSSLSFQEFESGLHEQLRRHAQHAHERVVDAEREASTYGCGGRAAVPLLLTGGGGRVPG